MVPADGKDAPIDDGPERTTVTARISDIQGEACGRFRCSADHHDHDCSNKKETRRMNPAFFLFRCAVAAAVLFLSVPSSASAQVRYSYNGNNYTTATLPYTTAMRLSGWFEMDAPIPPNTTWPTNLLASITAYSFFDGVNTLTNGNSGIYTADFATDNFGNLTSWEINLSGPVPAAINTPVDMITTNSGSDDVDADANCVQVVNGICDNVSQLNGASSINPGAWTRDLPVPTMSRWGLIAFMMVLGAGSIYRLRRRDLPAA